MWMLARIRRVTRVRPACGSSSTTPGPATFHWATTRWWILDRHMWSVKQMFLWKLFCSFECVGQVNYISNTQMALSSIDGRGVGDNLANIQGAKVFHACNILPLLISHFYGCIAGHQNCSAEDFHCDWRWWEVLLNRWVWQFFLVNKLIEK